MPVFAPVEPPQPGVQQRVVPLVADHAHVAAEQGEVGGIEADQGRVEADVGEGEVPAEEVGGSAFASSSSSSSFRFFAKVRFEAVEGGE